MEELMSAIRGNWLRLRTDEKGALGAEWVVIVAILVLAAIGITAYVMNSADATTAKVDATYGKLETELDKAPTAGLSFGDGT